MKPSTVAPMNTDACMSLSASLLDTAHQRVARAIDCARQWTVQREARRIDAEISLNAMPDRSIDRLALIRTASRARARQFLRRKGWMTASTMPAGFSGEWDRRARAL